jgi:hypothetical protein
MISYKNREQVKGKKEIEKQKRRKRKKHAAGEIDQ